MWLPFLEELANDEDRPRTVVAIVPHISDTWHGARAVVGSVHMDQEGEFEAPEDPAEEPTEPEIDVIEVREVEEIPLTSSTPHPRGRGSGRNHRCGDPRSRGVRRDRSRSGR